MQTLLKSLSASYDLVVLDAPPVLVIADPIPLIGKVDGVIVVARLNRTTTDQAQNLRRQLENLGAPLLGVVANRVKSGSGYGYGYYYADSGSDEPASPQS
jgi:Mrp family chromosome partitioning ATPase